MTFNYPHYNSFKGVGSSDIEAVETSYEGGIKQVRHSADASSYIMSKNLWGNNFGTAISASKDMSSTSGRSIPSSVFPSGYSTQPSGTRYYWSDWSNDVFDGWGDFYIYDQTGASNYITFATMNQADGSFYNETQTHGLKTYKVRHGWVSTGVFKLDITCTDPTWGFTVGHYGNMGSDSNTLGGTNSGNSNGFTVYFMWNQQRYSSAEVFSVYMIPKLYSTYLTWNFSTTPGMRQGLIPNDNRAVWGQGWITHGFLIYYAKSLNISSLVTGDLQIQQGGNYSGF